MQSNPDHDLLIVGGGINGAGIARDAAGRGLRVLLVERDTLAAHPSSASSKLIHGGLRYLEQGAIGLVRESLQERERLMRIAPGLVRPLELVMPIAAIRSAPPALATIACAHSRLKAQISSASCSTQPSCG